MVNKKYTYITISGKERLALETATQALATLDGMDFVIDTLQDLLKRSQHQIIAKQSKEEA